MYVDSQVFFVCFGLLGVNAQAIKANASQQGGGLASMSLVFSI